MTTTKYVYNGKVYDNLITALENAQEDTKKKVINVVNNFLEDYVFFKKEPPKWDMTHVTEFFKDIPIEDRIWRSNLKYGIKHIVKEDKECNTIIVKAIAKINMRINNETRTVYKQRSVKIYKTEHISNEYESQEIDVERLMEE